MSGRLLTPATLGLAMVVVVVITGCGGVPPDGAPGTTAATPEAATPVEVALVELATLDEVLSAPGRTVTLSEETVRAPFQGTVTALTVVEGEHVARGQRIGSIIARDSAAALAGAEQMARSARSATEEADARRASELAESRRVEAPLVSTVTGWVVRRAASAGDRVAEGQDLLALAAAGSLVFRAEVAPGDLVQVGAGDSASVELSGEPEPLGGAATGLLPPLSTGVLTGPVRFDLARPPRHAGVGLFGIARITVARHESVPVVPVAAVLRDDLRGTARVGTLGADGRLRWIDVETGLEEDGRVEIVAPRLEAGSRVVVSGHVGLDEGTPVAARP